MNISKEMRLRQWAQGTGYGRPAGKRTDTEAVV